MQNTGGEFKQRDMFGGKLPSAGFNEKSLGCYFTDGVVLASK